MSNAAQAMVNELKQEAAATRRVLERVPADRLDWQPHAKSMSLGQLALHVASIPGNLARLCQGDGIDAATVSFTPPSPQDAADLLPTLDRSIEEASTFLSGLDDQSASSPWRLTVGEREVFSIPRLGVARSLMLNHWYHHRGQLVVYLRLLEVPVPAVYGRSADDNPFAQAPRA